MNFQNPKADYFIIIASFLKVCTRLSELSETVMPMGFPSILLTCLWVASPYP